MTPLSIEVLFTNPCLDQGMSQGEMAFDKNMSYGPVFKLAGYRLPTGNTV